MLRLAIHTITTKQWDLPTAVREILRRRVQRRRRLAAMAGGPFLDGIDVAV